MVWTVSGPDIRKMPDKHAETAEELSKEIDRLNGLVFQGLFGSDIMLRMANSKLTNLRAAYAKLRHDLEEHYAIEEDMERYFRDNPDKF